MCFSEFFAEGSERVPFSVPLADVEPCGTMWNLERHLCQGGTLPILGELFSMFFFFFFSGASFELAHLRFH